MANRKAKPIRIYEFDQTSFNNNGICTLFPKSAVITRDLNEYKYYLDLTHPIDETGKWKEITQDRIIVANEQPFRIKFVQKTSREIVAYCEQIFFDLNNNFIEDTNIKGKNGNTALNQILSNTNYAHPFSGTSNIQITNNSRLVRKNVLSAIIGDNENSFVNRWGGELDIDGFTFKINTRIGRNNGYKVEYSKNMTGINAKFDMRNVVTKIRPVGFDGIKLEELFVDSPLINSYAMPIIREYKYEDVKWKGSPNYQAPLDGEDDGAYETLAEAQAELKRRALAEFSENEVDLPTVNYNVNFVELSNTDEYANYQALSSINIGDDVVIRHKILDINIPARCTAYKYNCLTCNFDEITLGHYNKNFFTDVKNAMNDVDSVKSTLQELPKQLNDILQQSKEYVTDFINGGFGGYVYYTPNAIYILDNPDVNVAKNVAVFNMNGLGFSNDGINGTFETAITRDGHIVADFIDTGILTADIIKTGILESKNGKSWLDMSTGEFNFGDKVKYENGKFEIIVESSDGGNTSLGNELNNMNNKIDSITNAPTLELTGEQAFLYENNFTGTPIPPSIKISAKVENVVNPTYQWHFRRSGETSWTPIANNNYNYYNVSHNNSTIFNNPSVKNVTFKCSVGDVYDEFTIVKVSSGSNGTIGNDGIGITEIQEQYYLSDSQQTLIGGTWQTTAPTWVKGKYIWTRTQFTYSNGNVTTTSPICVTGKDGADGLNGGVSVENVDVFYYQSTSATSLQGGSWTTTAPTWVNGKYVWSKTITYLDNGTQIESNPVCITGERGQNGIDGINGTNGKDGISTYFFIRYSEFSDGSNMTSTPNAKTKYMGTATTTNNVAPTTPSSYTWTLVKGADGKDGEQGVAGANGSSSYLHIKYSNDGRTFTANNGEELGTWIGTYVDTNPIDSSVFSDYNWVRFVGEDGADAYTVLLSNENHTFPSTYEGNIESAITTTTVAVAYKGKTSVIPTIGTLPTVTGLSLSKSGNTVTIVANKGTSLADTGTFKIPVIVDGITFEKTFSWSKSKNGLSGTDGEDGYTVFLTNENFTFVADDTGNVTKAQSTTTNILAYKGSKSLSFTIGTLPTVNGLTLSKTSDTITIKANTGTSLADVGSFDIIINADGKSFTKKFSWSKTKTGASGSNAKYVTVTGEQVFKYTNNFSGNPTPQVIKVTATPFNITNPVYVWEYKQVGSTTWQPISTATNANSDNYDVSHNNTTIWGSGSTAVKQVTIRCTVNGVSDEISLVKVSDGAKGDTGATGSSGIGISNITEYYAVSSSNTTAPTSWSTTVPTMTATNKYLWNYETITYSNNTTTNTSKRVIGAYGDKGSTGATGATGNGISKITNYYLASSSSSGVTTSTSGWTTSVQSVSSSKKYLWNYEVVTYTNGSTTTTTPCIIGAYGDTGDGAKTVSLTSSSQVFKSTDGGLTFTPDNIVITPNYQNVSYSKWQYSTNGGSSWTDVSSSTNGVTYSSTSLTLSKSSTLFTDKITSIIFKIITNNSSVTDTITIVKLYDVTDLKIGATNYLRQSSNYSSPYWSNKGATITDEYYMGSKVYKVNTIWGAMTYKKNKELELEPETEYILSAYIKKDNGITYDSGANMSWYGLSVNTTVVALDNLTTSWKQYSVKRKGKEITVNGDGAGIRIEPNKAITGGYIYVAGIQIEKGNKATDWKPNTNDLENAYTIVLTNEAQVIPTNSSRVPTSSATYYTDIVVYQGTTQRTDYTIGTINSANGITVSKTSSRVNFAVSTGTTITADGGNFTIPITIDNKTFNKTFSWSCSKQGSTGATGATGNAGADAYTVILTNESHTFATQNNGNISSAISTTTQVLAYKGASSITPTIGTLPTVNGLTLSKSGTTITIQANTGTSLADSGSFNIPVTVDGKSFTKTFSWSKSKQGATGATGATGANGTNAKSVDIMASTQVFKSTDGGATFFPDTITLTPSLQNINFSKWQYSINGGSTWLDVVSGEHGFVLSGSGDTIEFYGNIVVSQTSLSFKSGATQTFNVSLASAPTKNQVVTINASGCTVDKTSLTFTPSNYNSIQTVTVGGSTVGNGTIVLSSPNVNSKTVNVTITQGTTTTVYGNIVTSASSLSFTSGSSTTFSVKLDKAPTNNQVVNIYSNGCNVNTSSLTFTPTNYNTYQTITVSGTNTGAGSITLSSLNVATKTITVTINSSGGNEPVEDVYGDIVLSTTSLSVNENSTNTFTVKLSTAPTNNQIVTLSVNNSNATINKTSLTFTPSNYSNAQTIIVTGTHDSSSYSNKTSVITLSSSNVSSKTVNVTIVNIDNNSGGGGTGSGSEVTIYTASQGFNTDGSLDGKSDFTHVETFINLGSNKNGSIVFGTSGSVRYIFYDPYEKVIGYSDSTSAISYVTVSEIQTLSPNAVYVRMSINKTTTIKLFSGRSASVTTMSLNDIDAQPVLVDNDSGKDSNYSVIIGKELTISKFSDLFTDTVTSIVFKALTTDSNLYDTITIVKLRDASDIDVDNIINSAVNPLIKTDEQLTQRLDNAFSDDVITAYEKIQIASDLKEIDAQYDDMTKTVNSYNDSSITGIYNEYKVAYNNLHTALDACLENMDVDTKLSNSVVKDAFLLYGTYYSHLRSAIDDYIKNSFDTTKSSITSLSTSVDIAISKSSTNEQNLNIISKHMKFSDEGWLELFATINGEEGRFKTTITDTKLSFTDNNQEVAYMSNQKLYINYAQINNDLQIGSIVATKSDKGGIVFKWQ